MKYFLQVLHFSLFFLVLITGGVLFFYSQPEDFRNILELLALIMSMVWPAFLVVFSVIKGKLFQSPEVIVSVYRNLLVRNLFLWISDLVLLFITCLVFYCLLGFRQVEFYTDYSTDIVVYYDVPNSIEDIRWGVISSAKPLKKRISLGVYEIYFQSNDGSQGGYHVEVSTIFKKASPIICNLNFPKQ